MGLTQLELSKRIGASTRTVIAYEAGTTTIRFEKLIRLGDAGVDINDLVYGSGTAPAPEVNEVIWARVKAWADMTCVDSKGRPMHELERYQIMQRVYRRLAGARTDAEVDDALLREDLAGSRRA